VDEKHLGGVRYEELELQLDLSLDKLVYDWITATWKQQHIRHDGSLVATDSNLKAVSEREFFRALITEVGIPALDAASKDSAYLSLRLAPEFTRLKPGAGKAVKSTVGRQKEWLAANFKLEIDGLETKRVSRVEALTVKQGVRRDEVGVVREAAEPTSLEFPDLSVTFPQSDADTWTKWFDAFALKGNNDPSQERSGKLTFLASDRKTPLGEVSFFNLGIFRLGPTSWQAGVEEVARLTAGLYCERMELAVP
jgi:hypothetical protein